jgi:Sulfotransferase family
VTDHHFVFVCGLQRSGTTMLYRFLGEHPAISALEGTVRATNEGQHNQTVYPADEYHSKGGQFAFRREARMTETSPLITDANREKLYAEWSRYWDTSAGILLEKSPPNLIRTRFLQAMFPNSSFIAILRHPIPVTLATSRWGKVKPHTLMRHWLKAHGHLVEDAPHLRRLHVMRYEDLVADPDAELARAFAFLGLADHAPGRDRGEGLNEDNFEADRILRTGVNDKYFQLWRDRRRDPVRRLYYDAIDLAFERPVSRYGYSMRQPRRLWRATAALPGLRDAPAVRAATARRVAGSRQS